MACSRVDTFCERLAHFAAEVCVRRRARRHACHACGEPVRGGGDPPSPGQAMAGTVQEVGGGAGASAKEVSDNLAELILLVKDKKPGADGRQWADQIFAPADKVRSACWAQLSEGGGWPNVGWREAYAFALLALALHHMQRHEDDGKAESGGDPVQALREAVKSLDLALIMSGSGASLSCAARRPRLPGAFPLPHTAMPGTRGLLLARVCCSCAAATTRVLRRFLRPAPPALLSRRRHTLSTGLAALERLVRRGTAGCLSDCCSLPGCADLVHSCLSDIEPHVVAAEAASGEQRKADGGGGDDEARCVMCGRGAVSQCVCVLFRPGSAPVRPQTLSASECGGECDGGRCM